MKNLRVEDQILVLVARRTLNDELKTNLRSLVQQKIAWEGLLATATKHKLLPLLYKHLDATCRDLVPQPVITRLKEEYFSNNQCVLYLMGELIRILDLLDSRNIRALAFKGPVLAAKLYGDLALRQAGDLDLLVHKKEFSKAKALLQSAGYLMEPQLTNSQEASHLRFHCEIQFLHSNEVSVIDLHWDLAPRTFSFPIDLEGLFSRAETVQFAGHSIRTFASEDLLLYLCMTGAKDSWNQLESVALIAELLRTPNAFAWPVLLERARETRGRKVLMLGLMLARELFGSEVPQEWLESLVEENNESRSSELAASAVESLRRWASTTAGRLTRDAPAQPTPFRSFRMNLQCMERKRDAFAALARAALVPTISDWKFVTLPDPLYPLYYVLRPLRLLGKYSTAVITR